MVSVFRHSIENCFSSYKCCGLISSLLSFIFVSSPCHRKLNQKNNISSSDNHNIHSTDCSIETIRRKNNCAEVCYKGVSSSLFRSGTRPPDLLKFSLGGVSGFSPLKGVPSFKSRSSVVASFSEGGREAFLGKGAKCSVDGLTGRSGKVKFPGSDKVCFCE